MKSIACIAAVAALCSVPGLWAGHVGAGVSTMVPIPGGERVSFFRQANGAETRIAVGPFELDVRPVSNADFLAFVEDQPMWRRSRVRAIYADVGYLDTWAGDLELGPGVDPEAPVTRVSWFAARAFAAWCGKRLPTVAEWEYAAAAPGRDGRSVTDVILEWYSRPASPNHAGRSQFVNTLGVMDMHGLIWEWTEDFNSGLAGNDSRTRESLDEARFCGAGALSAADRSDYAGFMRYAFRNSLKGRYTGRLLGFRCARD